MHNIHHNSKIFRLLLPVYIKNMKCIFFVYAKLFKLSKSRRYVTLHTKMSLNIFVWIDLDTIVLGSETKACWRYMYLMEGDQFSKQNYKMFTHNFETKLQQTSPRMPICCMLYFKIIPKSCSMEVMLITRNVILLPRFSLYFQNRKQGGNLFQ